MYKNINIICAKQEKTKNYFFLLTLKKLCGKIIYRMKCYNAELLIFSSGGSSADEGAVINH